MTPTSMEPRPAKRNSPSPSVSSRAKARFTACGCRKGAMPSNTSSRPSASRRSERLRDTRCFAEGGRSSALGRRGPRAGACFLEIAEEFSIGCEDEQIAVLADRALISLKAAPEPVELRVVREGARVDRRSGRIALAAGAQPIALGIRDDHRALPLGGRADGGAFLLSLGTVAARGLGEGLLHALVDTRGDLIGEIDALHAHIDEVHPETLGVVARLAEHLARDRGALGRDDLLERVLSDYGLDAVLDDLRQALRGDAFAAGCGVVKGRRILDAPLHVEVDDEAAAVIGEEGLAGIGLGEDAAIELRDPVPRPLEVES